MRIPTFTTILCLFTIPVVGEAPDTGGVSETVVKRELSLPASSYRYTDPVLPDHVTTVAAFFDNTPDENPITDAGATLGRVLFYDPTLSVNGSTSCASCHNQGHAFTDERRFSKGFAGKEVGRNSMSLVNLRYYRPGKFFWDERAGSLEDQVLMPIENSVEMGHRLSLLLPQLQNDPLYPPLFQSAFGTPSITETRLARALAQFIRSMVSVGSRYDIGRAQVESVLDPFPNFSEQENYGKQQFFGRAKCAECHLPEVEVVGASADARQSAFFHLESPTVNGIDSDSADLDGGLGAVTGLNKDWGRFKATSLRNVELTAPYMHDGRFRTLDQVIEHYNWSVKPHRNLDPRLEDFAANGLALPEVEKVALSEFLKTLTDSDFIRDPKFSDPFTSD